MAEFQVVSGKKRRRNKRGVDQSQQDFNQKQLEDDDFKPHIFKKRLTTCSQEVLLSDLFSLTFETIKGCLADICDTQCDQTSKEESVGQQDDKQQVDVLCYGIGHFTTCPIARYQMALLMALRQKLDVPCQNCFFYDPVFAHNEKDFLHSQGFVLITENEEGKRACNKPTLAFLPHCGKALYNNLLWKNMTTPGQLGLHNLVLVGNSFSQMVDRTPSRILKKTAGYIVKLEAYTQEVPLPSTFPHQDVFNDLSVHTFANVRLQAAPAALWEEGLEEPVYSGEDAEYIPR